MRQAFLIVTRRELKKTGNPRYVPYIYANQLPAPALSSS